MSEYENPNEVPEQPPIQSDPYTYYSGHPMQSSPYRYVPEPKSAKKKKRSWVLPLVVALCCLLGGACGVGGVLMVQHIQAQQVEEVPEENVSHVLQGIRENSVIEIVQVGTGTQMTPAEVYAANVNSTVGITTSVTTNFWGYQSTSAASGSGFIISDDGYILTNYHVIEDAVKDSSVTVSVSFENGEKYDAKVVGGEQDNDVAVLKIEAAGLTPVTLGDSDKLVVGESVYAIGNPLGELTATMTAGYVSAMDRDVDFRSLYGEVQRLLGRSLNTEELKILLGFVRYLGLPTEVVSVLVCYCKDRARQRGSLRNPSLRTIEKEAYAWAEQGIDNLEEAAAFIQSQNMRNSRLSRMMGILQIRGRSLTAAEERYAAGWMEMGFEDEVISMAYERTCLNTGGLNWNYMNKILQRWHEAGLHTAEAVRTGDRKPGSAAQSGQRQLDADEIAAIQRMMREG